MSKAWAALVLVLATSSFLLFWFPQSQACITAAHSSWPTPQVQGQDGPKAQVRFKRGPRPSQPQTSSQAGLKAQVRSNRGPSQAQSRSKAKSVSNPMDLSTINATGDAGNPDRLLVIVIAGGSRGLIYPSYRALWKAMADRAASFGVHIYLVSFDPNVKETILENHQLIFNGTDTLVPGVLNETLLALDHIYANNLTGSQAGFVLRTNLSSFWKFNKLLQWLKGKLSPLVAAFIGGSGPDAFPSGAGTLMSVDVCKNLLAKPRGPLLSSIDPDDIVLGRALKPVPLTPMSRYDLLGGQPDVRSVLAMPIYHYRIKSQDELRDIGIMTWMFNEWYEEDKSPSAKTFSWREI